MREFLILVIRAQKGSSSSKLRLFGTWSMIFAKKRAIFGQILEKMHIFCLFNDLKLLNAEINDLRSRFNSKLMLI